MKVRKKTVDATLTLTNIPATKSPDYSISDGVNLVPINKLSDLNKSWKRYVIIGAGKTGLDAILYLLDNNVNPEKIVWIVPNDCWYFNRDSVSDLSNLHKIFPEFYGAVLASVDVNDAYKKGEKIGHFMRLDKDIWPNKMRAATVSSKEMEKIKNIKNIIRLGRISHIEKDKILFVQGDSIPTHIETLHVDCSTAGTKFSPLKEKVFDDDRINLMMTQVTQQCTSAAVIAALEVK